MASSKTILAALPPALRNAYDHAEKCVDEGFFDRAERVFEDLIRQVPANEELKGRLAAVRARIAEGRGPVSELEDEAQVAAESLFRDLELGESLVDADRRDLAAHFGGCLEMPASLLRGVGLDLSVTAGISGDWDLALKFLQKLIEAGDDRLELKLWQLRCAVELENCAEALALGNALRWPPAMIIHVNYLTGLAYHMLGMRDQALMRFKAVHRRDPLYRDVAQRVVEA